MKLLATLVCLLSVPAAHAGLAYDPETGTAMVVRQEIKGLQISLCANVNSQKLNDEAAVLSEGKCTRVSRKPLTVTVIARNFKVLTQRMKKQIERLDGEIFARAEKSLELDTDPEKKLNFIAAMEIDKKWRIRDDLERAMPKSPDQYFQKLSNIATPNSVISASMADLVNEANALNLMTR